MTTEDDDLVEVEIDGETKLVPRSLAEKLGLTVVKPAEKVKRDYSFYCQIGLLLMALLILVLVWNLAMMLANSSVPANSTEPIGNHLSPAILILMTANFKVYVYNGCWKLGKAGWKIGKPIYDFYFACRHCQIWLDKRGFAGNIRLRCPFCNGKLKTHFWRKRE